MRAPRLRCHLVVSGNDVGYIDEHKIDVDAVSNNFWGRDDAGVDPLLTRMANARTTCDELKAFYTARAALEEDYAKKLLHLSRKPLGSVEQGSLRTALDVARGETESMGKQHGLIAQQMKSELEEPLAAFSGGMKERRKIVQTGIERLHKTKQQQTAHVHKSRDKYEQDCLRIKGYLAQGHMVMGQEERKNKAKLEKTQINMATNSNEYEAAVKVLEETTGRWNKEWKGACDVSAAQDMSDWLLTGHRNSKILRKSEWISQSRRCGHSPTLLRPCVYLMTPPARRCALLWKTVRLRRTLCTSSRPVVQARRFPIRLGISTFAEATQIPHQRCLKMTITRSHSLLAPPILPSDPHHLHIQRRGQDQFVMKHHSVCPKSTCGWMKMTCRHRATSATGGRNR